MYDIYKYHFQGYVEVSVSDQSTIQYELTLNLSI